MPNTVSSIPNVLAIGGHDPSGGAGIQADIEAIHANGGQPLTLITALTAQNTQRFESCRPVSGDDLRQQAALLWEDMPIHAIKFGLIPTMAIAAALRTLSESCSGVPIVLDPVLAAGVGTDLTDDGTVQGLRGLLSRVTVITPNTHEAVRLSGRREPHAAAEELLTLGCSYVLITGTHAQTPAVVNTLYSATRTLSWTWERLPHTYHGSGCTLASALATLLARGFPVDSAAGLAQEYTWRSLRAGRQLGHGQYHPHRIQRREP